MGPMPSLSRTSSSTSISSSDDAVGSSTVNNTLTARRTRKRFTSVQLAMLENLFHQNSHPSREEREEVAKSGGMETKSVTIWFQNKRQTERKVAMHNATNVFSTGCSNAQLSSSPPPKVATAQGRSVSSRPSLDHFASRSELRVSTPRTPSRRHNPRANIWDNMPSSPVGPPVSPPAREYVAFGKSQRTRRTLEWACAAARLAEKDGADASHGVSYMGGDCTDDETDEAVTPTTTWRGSDIGWKVSHGDRMTAPCKAVQDDDMMKAALALCGLGRR